MRPLAEQFRDRLIRIVVPQRPAALVVVHQAAALDDLCNLLADCTVAKQLMRAKGYGDVGMSMLEIAQLLPPAPAPSMTPSTRTRKKKR